jgi:hypothetical protein
MDNSNTNETSDIITGIVKNGTFIVDDSKKSFKLTEAHIMEAITPEAKQIDLTKYEGKKIKVSYRHSDDKWLYAAHITDARDNGY